MSDAASLKIVQDILLRERQSLLQFVAEAYPWARMDEEPVLGKVRKLIDEQQQAGVKLATFLQRHRATIPPFNNFPFIFTTLNFVSLDFLMPQLIEHQRQDIERIGRGLARITDPAARSQVEALLALKNRHLKVLEELLPQASKAAVYA